jgi:tetratricopeptide (TPR) repeat protein
MKTMSCKLRPSSNLGLRHTLNKAFALSGLLGALCAAPAFADDTTDVSRLLRAGQFAEAMSKVDASLAQRPRDAQMRFLKGVILTEQNKSAEAISVFTKLTEDFPDLPEPYNNLAVLYASNGQYDKARAALDMAIRTNPAYATAYENLGDVHAKLASQAYDKALQLDSANSGAKTKLTLLRTLAGNTNSSLNAKASASPTSSLAAKAQPPVATVAQAPKATAPAVPPGAQMSPPVAPANPKVATAPTPPVAAKSARTAPTQAAPAKTEPAKVAKAEAKPAKPARKDDDHDEVLNVVNNWAKSWSAQDVKAYLNFYGNDFQTPKGESRKAWADERQSRIAGKGRINVKVESPQVAINGNTATVKFRQVYVSDRLKADSRKTLVLTKQGGKWQIKQERTGS